MPDLDYPWHQRHEVIVAADPAKLFAHLDDPHRLASHMEKPSLMMAGATMQVTLDALEGRAVGSVIRMAGRVLGIQLALDEVITEREPPSRKVWQTLGEPRLLVIGAYRMGFTIAPHERGSRLLVFLDYRRPARGLARGLGWLFGRAYAAWCTQKMAGDAAAAFGRVGAP